MSSEVMKARLRSRWGQPLREALARSSPDRTTAAMLSARLRRPAAAAAPERMFETTDGRAIAVLPHYRYRQKAAWRTYTPMAALDILDRAGRLDAGQRESFRRFQGTRTLAAPYDAIADYAAPVVAANRDAFIEGTLDGAQTPVANLGRDRIAREVKAARAKLVRRLSEAGAERLLAPAAGATALEIGFGTGIPLIALEGFGYAVHGIDNSYGGTQVRQGAAPTIRDRIGARVEFHHGDVARQTGFGAESFDLIVSDAVLEHLLELPRAFAEMHRLLRPGGRMVHVYHPFFGVTGAHTRGVLDSPLAHARMSQPDFERYLTELRPNEAPQAIGWCRAALTRAFPARAVQRALASNGFLLDNWIELRPPAALLAEIEAEHLAEALTMYPQVALNDLLCDRILFVARKRQ